MASFDYDVLIIGSGFGCVAALRAAEKGYRVGAATHESELPYLFDLLNAPFHPAFSPDQQTLAASMQAAWVNFAATGKPATVAQPRPAFGDSQQMLSLVPPQPQLETDFATRHHCAFWAAG